MKNSDLPAMPLFSSEAKPGMVRVKGGDKNNSVATAGLTKREMFAMHAMQGLLANSYGDSWGVEERDSVRAKQSVKMADALLKELEK